MAGGNDAIATWGLELDSSSLTQGSVDSAKALEDLKDRIQGDTQALREMQKALKNLQGGTAVNIAQFRDLKDKIAAQKITIASSTQSYLSLGGNFKEVAKKSDDASKGFKNLTEAARAAPGPLGGLSSKLGAIDALFAGGAMAASALAVAGAIAAVTAAALAGAVALGAYGISVANARRSELLHLDALTKVRYGWMGMAGAFRPAADKASFLQDTIDKVSGSVALSRDQVAGYAEELYRTGLRGGNLQAALQGVATVSATQGEAAASAFKGMAIGAQFAGGSVKKLADDVKARLGGIAASQLLDLDVQSKKLRESFAMIFSGLKIDKLLEGLSSITDLFKQNEAVGAALKTIVDSLFGPLIDSVSGPGSLLVKRFIQGIVIEALELTIVILKLRNWFLATFKDSSVLKGLDMTKTALIAGEIAVGAFAASVLIAGFVLANFVAFVMAVPIAIGLLAYGIYAGVKALVNLAPAAWKAGESLVSGIVGGIKNGAKWVIDAISNLGTDAMKAFKHTLGIASPSRVAMRASIEVPRGVAGGIRAGKPEVDRAMDSLVQMPSNMEGDSKSRRAGTGRGASANAAAPSVTINELHVHAKGDGADDFAQEVKTAVINFLGEALVPVGAPVP